MAEKHSVMLSYQWDLKEIVEKVYNGLTSSGISVWMDVKGGMSGSINESMAAAVEEAAVVCCFMTQKYQDSKNCKKELNYADDQDKIIIPVMGERGFKAQGWLGIITAGLLWIDFRETNNMPTRVQSLAKEIIVQGAEVITVGAPKTALPAAKIDVNQTMKGRAFIHKITGKYMAESGQTKFHPASGSRSSLVLSDEPKDTSYWKEGKADKKSGITFYRNVATDGYLGYDPNGDYIYTKGQHYGAEEWILTADDGSDSGERQVVLFAKFGQKYLAIRNGKFTGVSTCSEDCIWILA